MRFVALKAWSNQLQAGSFYLTFWGCQTQGLLSFFFFFLALSLLLSGQKITIWGFLECWRAFHPFADLRQKPCFDFTAYFVGRHRSLAGWITLWIPDCRKNHTALLGSSRTLCEILKLGFLVLSALSVFLVYPFLSPLSLTFGSWKSHHCTPSVSPSSNLPLGRFCIFYQTLLVPGFCIFILNSWWGGWCIEGTQAFRRGEGRRVQLWVMRSR